MISDKARAKLELKLVKQCRKGNSQKIENLLQEYPKELYNRCFAIACDIGCDIPVLRLLLSKCSSTSDTVDAITSVSFHQMSALQHAIKSKHRQITLFLLHCIKDQETLSLQNPKEFMATRHPILLATENGWDEVVYLMLSIGNDSTSISNTYQSVNNTAAVISPLLIACEKGFVSIVNVLLRRGADVTLGRTEQHEYSALEIAVVNGHLECVSLLLEAGGAVPTKRVINLAYDNDQPHIGLLLSNKLNSSRRVTPTSSSVVLINSEKQISKVPYYKLKRKVLQKSFVAPVSIPSVIAEEE